MHPPTETLGFRHVAEEETAADRKAIDLLKNSPYAQKLDMPGLFLREVAARGSALSSLLTSHLGNGFTDRKGAVDRLEVLMNSAPALDPNKLGQIAALPLGGRRQAKRPGRPHGIDQDHTGGH